MRAHFVFACFALLALLQGCSSVHIVEASTRYERVFRDSSTSAPGFKAEAFPKRLLLSVPKQDAGHWSAASHRLAALDAALTKRGASVGHGPVSGLSQAELEALALEQGCEGILVFEAFGWPESTSSRYFAGSDELLDEVSRGVYDLLSDGPHFELSLAQGLLEVQGDLFAKRGKAEAFDKAATFLAKGRLIDFPYPTPFTQRFVWPGDVAASSSGTRLDEVFGRQAIEELERIMLRDLIYGAGS